MSSQFARLRGALDRVGTTTPGTIVGVFAEDLTAIMNHYADVVREAAELKARAQPAQAVPLLTDDEIDAVWDAIPQTQFWWRRYARAVEAAVRAKLGVAVPWLPIETAPKDGSIFLCWVTAERYGETDEGQQYEQDVSQADFGWWVPGENRDYFDCGCGQIGDRQHISHWMPLPPPPIVGKEGA